jgi:hypothetical protein
MEVVAGVVQGNEHAWVSGVLRGFVEVDDAVELGGGAYPLIDGLAHGFAFCRLVARTDEGREGCADDLDAVSMGAGGELAEAGDEVRGGDDVVGVLGSVALPMSLMLSMTMRYLTPAWAMTSRSKRARALGP